METQGQDELKILVEHPRFRKPIVVIKAFMDLSMFELERHIATANLPLLDPSLALKSSKVTET